MPNDMDNSGRKGNKQQTLEQQTTYGPENITKELR